MCMCQCYSDLSSLEGLIFKDLCGFLGLTGN